MAEGGSSPLGDPGGLHLYNLNGGPHKLAELVADTGPVDMLGGPTNPVAQMSYAGSPEPSPYANNMQGSFTFPNSLGYDAGAYEDMKRSTHIQGSYYNPMESSSSYINSHGSLFEMPMQGFSSSAPDMYKTSSETVSYTDMPSKANNISPDITVKKEKLDYTDQMGMINSHTSDIPYPPNTCVADWNYFNSMNPNNCVSNVEAGQYGSYPPPLLHMPSNHYHGGQYFTTQNQEPSTLGLSNEDIHHQSKKITQNIINTEWSNDTMTYKPQVYPGFTEEPAANKKRRAIPDKKGKDAKSRRKRSGDSAVASILAGGNADKKNGNIRTHENTLDSCERNTLVTALMNNLRSTVQFESFCLSLPRSPAKETAFHSKVRFTADMISALSSKTILSSPFPPNYIQGAEKVISAFKKALNNMEKMSADFQLGGSRQAENQHSLPPSGKNSKDREKNLSCDQVEEHIPHSMVWVLQVGHTTFTANWEGQFVATVNPVQNTLSCSIFQFSPLFSTEGITCLQQCRLSKHLAQDIIENMQQFEVSRQLRFDVNLKEVLYMYLYAEQEQAGVGCLLLEMSQAPDFFQRWLHTSAEEKNKWHRRPSFFRSGSSGEGSEVICIGGLISELHEVVALILASNPELKAMYEAGLHNPFNLAAAMQYNGQRSATLNGNGSPGTDAKADNDSTATVNGELRRQIKQVIAKHGISVKDVDDTADGGSEDANEIILDADVSGCFRDYVNFMCKSAMELDTILDKKVSPSLHGFYDNDFDMSLVPDGDLEALTVGQLISQCCSDVVYYSFCRNSVGQLGHDVHCSRCRKCVTFRYQHCTACNRCSEVKSICEFCGHLRHELSRVIIKPLSVFRSELKTGALNIDNVKDGWISALGLPDNDVLSLSHWTVYGDRPGMPDNVASVEYNSSNAMVDQLGLLNPVGFLLGQGAAGATRKHRRYKGMQPSQKSLDTSSKGANSTGGCMIQ